MTLVRGRLRIATDSALKEPVEVSLILPVSAHGETLPIAGSFVRRVEQKLGQFGLKNAPSADQGQPDNFQSGFLAGEHEFAIGLRLDSYDPICLLDKSMEEFLSPSLEGCSVGKNSNSNGFLGKLL